MNKLRGQDTPAIVDVKGAEPKAAPFRQILDRHGAEGRTVDDEGYGKRHSQRQQSEGRRSPKNELASG